MTEQKPLTKQELTVLTGMASGLSNREIGKHLFVSEDTVKTHAQRVFRKLGARDRANAASLGHRQGLLSSGRIEDTFRLSAARACLDKWRTERDVAPAESRFARLYDQLAACLAARPDPPS